MVRTEANTNAGVWLVARDAALLAPLSRQGLRVFHGSHDAVEQAQGRLGEIDAMVFVAPVQAKQDVPLGGEALVMHVAEVLEEFVTSARAAALAMSARKGGEIVVVCDIVGDCGRAGFAAQSAAASALAGAAKCLAKELGRHGVNVNVVSHGPQPELGGALVLTDAEQKLFDLMGLGRAGNLTQLALNIAHFARGGHWVTGQVMRVDNGMIV